MVDATIIGKKQPLTVDDRRLGGRVLAMIFEKPSTRTRISFEVGMKQLGGDTVVLRGEEMQLHRDESIGDTAKILSRFCSAVMLRTHDESFLLELASGSTIPVINGLTDQSHPCQILADLVTYEEKRGAITGKKVAWCGDGNNVCASWIHAAVRLDFVLHIACPSEFSPSPDLLQWAEAEIARNNSQHARIMVTRNPVEAVTGAQLINTYTWVSMGNINAARRKTILAPYQVTESLMANAPKEALFMHCLPAHRGEEVTSGVVDGPQSVVWDEAENRLHAQKTILLWCHGISL